MQCACRRLILALATGENAGTALKLIGIYFDVPKPGVATGTNAVLALKHFHVHVVRARNVGIATENNAVLAWKQLLRGGSDEIVLCCNGG